MSPTSLSSGAPGSTTSRTSRLELPRDKLIVFTGLSGSGKSRSPSTRSTPRASAATSSRCRPTPASSSARWTSPTSTSSRACRRPSPSTRSRPPATPAPRSAPSPRSTTTSACSTPASACPTARTCGAVVTRQTPQQIVDRILELPEGTRFQVLAPVVRGRKGEYEGAARRPGQAGLRPGPGRRRACSSWPTTSVELARYEQHTIEVVVDRLVRRDGHRAPAHRLAGDGAAPGRGRGRGRDRRRRTARRDAEDETLTFSQHLACPTTARRFDELAPRNFSFNSPYGACPHCDGLGTRFEVDPELVVPNPDLSLDEGAIAPWAGAPRRVLPPAARGGGRDLRVHDRRRRGRSSRRPQQKVLLYGVGHQAGPRRSTRTATAAPARTTPHYEGVDPVPPAPPRRGRVRLRRASRSRATCARCRAPTAAAPGSSPSRSAVTVDGRNIHELCDAVDRRGGRGAARPRAVRARPHDRRAGGQGDQRPPAVPARRRPRLPHPRPLGRHPRRRRGPAHPAGSARSAPASSACCTCSTSRRSACTSATTAGSSTR